MRRPDEIPSTIEHFVPPFCPNEECEFHLNRADSAWPWQPRGFRRIRRHPRIVREFRCTACGRWFRSSVFGPEYWTKKPGLGLRTVHLLHAGCAMRQISRTLHVAPTTIRRRVRILGKQSLLIAVEQNRSLAKTVTEELAIDGMRTFAGSQYEPLDLHTPVLVDSGYVLGVNIAGLRRSGRMREDQKRKRTERDERLGRPDPRGRERRTRELLLLFRELARTTETTVRCDEEPDYARALERPSPIEGLTLRTVNSRVRRDAHNPLFRVNVLHRYMRHAMRNLVRETIAFAKTSAGLLDRAWIFTLTQNNIKGVSERTAELSRTTPAMRLGLRSRPATARQLFARRRFPKRVGMPDWLRTAYLGTFKVRPNEKVKPYIHRFVR